MEKKQVWKVIRKALTSELLEEDEVNQCLEKLTIQSTLGGLYILASMEFIRAWSIHRLYKILEGEAKLTDTFVLPSYVCVMLCDMGSISFCCFKIVDDVKCRDSESEYGSPIFVDDDIAEKIKSRLPKLGEIDEIEDQLKEALEDLLLLRAQQMSLADFPEEERETYLMSAQMSPDRRWAIVCLTEEHRGWGYLYRCNLDETLNFLPVLEERHRVGFEPDLSWDENMPATLLCSLPLPREEEVVIRHIVIGRRELQLEVHSALQEIIPKDLINIVCGYVGGVLEFLEQRIFDV